MTTTAPTAKRARNGARAIGVRLIIVQSPFGRLEAESENLEATRIARVQDIIVFAARKSTGAHCRRTIGHQLFLSLDSQ